MATAHLTLEEAAQRLGITPDEFKRRLKTDPAFKILVPIRDGATLRFKANAVDELARQLGAASDPGLLLAPLPEKGELDSDDFHVPTLLHPSASAASEVSSGDDIFSISSEEVRPDKPKGKPDSDVRLEAIDRKSAGVEDKNTAVPTEEIDLDVVSSQSAIIRGASSSKLVPPAPSSSKIVATEAAAGLPSDSDSSEFELSLDSDSDDFQLSLNADAGDEVKIGEEAPASPARGASGINLRQPADSGISLEKDDAKLPVSQDKPSDEELDFELTLDSNTAASGIKLSGLTSKPAMTADSDSEFELTLDDSSGGGASMEHAVLEELGSLAEEEEKEQTRGDIFETDFEVPPLESGSASEAVALETDTDIAEGDLSSDVVVEESTEEALPEAEVEEVDLAQVDLEEGPSASQALRGVPTVVPEEELISAAAQYQPVPWGPLPAILLLMAFPFMFLGVLMGYQAVETMVGYQQPQKPVAPLLRSIASTLDMELKDQ